MKISAIGPLFLVFSVLLFSACKKEESVSKEPVFENRSLSLSGFNAVNISADVIPGSKEIIQYGIVTSTIPNAPLTNTNRVSFNGNGGTLSAQVGLFFNVTTYLRLYAITTDGVHFSEQDTFEYKNYFELAYKGGKMMVTSQNNDVFFTQWLNNTSFLGATDSSDGRNNISKILNQSTSSSPALYCENLNIGGYSDWYLPAIHELEFMAQNKSTLLLRLNRYWSSTELNANEVLGIDVSVSNNIFKTPKSNFGYCRCVRRE